MPSVAQEEPVIPSAKKRRRDDFDDNIHLQFNPQHIHISQNFHASIRNHDSSPYYAGLHDTQGNTALLSRRILPLAKRSRIDHGGHEQTQRQETDARGRQHDRPRTTSPPRHTNPSPSPATSDALQQTNANSRPQPARAMSAALLSPCHVCHRRPTKKSELDDFADCEGCGQRTCFICMRQCLGWSHDDVEFQIPPGGTYSTSFTMEDAGSENESARVQRNQRTAKEAWAGGGGHRQTVCSGCCVERGPDGDVVCLGCLPFVEG